MIRSMTGFGRGRNVQGLKQCTVEIKTVNHRYCDLTPKMPRELMLVEEKIRAKVQQYICRGKVDLFINYKDLNPGAKTVTSDRALISSYFAELRNTALEMNIPYEDKTEYFFRVPDGFIIELNDTSEEVLWEMVEPALTQALVSLVAMRKREGEHLQEALLKNADEIEKIMEEIKERSYLVPEEYKQKLQQRLKDFAKDVTVDPQKIALEVAIIADKSCIDEEITRMASHIKQYRNMILKYRKGLDDIDTVEEGIGRQMDFLVQEMNREANTMGSKSVDITITRNVIALKGEIEKIREQIQNVE